jgi:hypothetical protein
VVEAVDASTGVIVEGKATVVVLQAQQDRVPAALRVFPTEISVEQQGNIQLAAYAVDANGVLVPGTSIEWELLDPRVGSLTNLGRLSAGDRSGNFPGSIKVSIANTSIEVIIDVQIIDHLQRVTQPFVSVSPQVVTVIPGQSVQFVAAALDPRGQAISPLEVTWRLESSEAGALTEDGKFVAGDAPGIYENLIRAHINAPEYEGGFATRASATVIITEVPEPGPGSSPAIEPAIFPSRLELSPGQSESLVVVGTDQTGAPLSGLRVRWRLDSQGLGQVSATGRVTAGSLPGVYANAIIAEIELPTGQETEVIEARATLVVRGPLDRVEIRPGVAEVGRGGRVQFLAVAYDANGISLPNVQYQWEMLDSDAGSIDQRGLFTATGSPGPYDNAVRVKAVQFIELESG